MYKKYIINRSELNLLKNHFLILSVLKNLNWVSVAVEGIKLWKKLGSAGVLVPGCKLPAQPGLPDVSRNVCLITQTFFQRKPTRCLSLPLGHPTPHAHLEFHHYNYCHNYWRIWIPLTLAGRLHPALCGALYQGHRSGALYKGRRTKVSRTDQTP